MRHYVTVVRILVYFMGVSSSCIPGVVDIVVVVECVVVVVVGGGMVPTNIHWTKHRQFPQPV